MAAPPVRRAWGLRTICAVTALAFAVPLMYLVIENIRSDAGAFGFLTIQALGPGIRTLALAVTVAAAATVVGTLAAWLVSRTDVAGKAVWRILLPLPLVIPSFVAAFVMIAAFAKGGLLETLLAPLGIDEMPAVRGFGGAAAILTLFTYPYVYLPVAARLRQLPSSLEESARLLGASGAATFRRVIVPQLRSSILAGSLLVFLYTISDFGVVQLMRFDALTRVIYATRLFDRSLSLALSLQLGLVALVVVAIERSLTSGPAQTGGQRANRPLRISLGRWRAPGFLLLSLLSGLALFVPVAVLLYWAIRGVARDATSGVLVTGSIWEPLVNTALVSVAAAVTAVVVVLPLTYLTVRHRGRLADASNAVVVAGFALPGLAISLALVYLTVSSPALSFLYQTLTLLVIAYVVHFGAQAMRTAQVALASVPLVVEDAARVLGVPRWRRFTLVELPLMRPGLLAGGGIVLLSAMKELPATLLLAPAGFQTLAMKTWQATESAFFADAAIAGLLLIALSGALTWLLVIRRSEVWAG